MSASRPVSVQGLSQQQPPPQYDLFNNPMVDAARKAMSPEQQEEYKKIGEYMYNKTNYKVAEIGSSVKEPKQEDYVMYAVGMLRSGGDPADLTDPELRALIATYGEKWYEKFDIDPSEAPKPFVEVTSTPPPPLAQTSGSGPGQASGRVVYGPEPPPGYNRRRKLSTRERLREKVIKNNFN